MIIFKILGFKVKIMQLYLILDIGKGDLPTLNFGIFNKLDIWIVWL